MSPDDAVDVGGIHWVGVGASVSVGNGDVGEAHAASSHAAATSPASEKRERPTFLSIVLLCIGKNNDILRAVDVLRN